MNKYTFIINRKEGTSVHSEYMEYKEKERFMDKLNYDDTVISFVEIKGGKKVYNIIDLTNTFDDYAKTERGVIEYANSFSNENHIVGVKTLKEAIEFLQDHDFKVEEIVQ